MTDKDCSYVPVSSEDDAQVSKRQSILAREVGVSLTISKKALDEVDRIEAETIKVIQEAQKFSWR